MRLKNRSNEDSWRLPNRPEKSDRESCRQRDFDNLKRDFKSNGTREFCGE